MKTISTFKHFLSLIADGSHKERPGTWPGRDEKRNRNWGGKRMEGWEDEGNGMIKGWTARQQPPVLEPFDRRDEPEQMLLALSACRGVCVFDSTVRVCDCCVCGLRH